VDGYDYLSQISRTRKKLDALKIKHKTYEQMADSVPTHPYDEPVVQKSRENKAPFIKWLDKMIEVDAQIEEKQAELNRLTSDALEKISRVKNENYQNLLMLRFISEYPWIDIATILDVSYSTVKRWYWFALGEFEEMNGDERS